MKNSLKFGLLCLFAAMAVSCGSTKKSNVSPAIQSSRTKTTNLQGDKVFVENSVEQGFEMADALNDEGTAMIRIPYKWFAGSGEADNQQIAKEIAQRNAYATISRVLNNAVIDKAEQGVLVNNGRVQQALKAHWQQVSASLQKGCEPFGATTYEYNPATKLYKATAKVGIRGDKFNQLLSTAGSFEPAELTGEELQEFIKINRAIMEAARGN